MRIGLPCRAQTHASAVLQHGMLCYWRLRAGGAVHAARGLTGSSKRRYGAAIARDLGFGLLGRLRLALYRGAITWLYIYLLWLGYSLLQ